VTITFPKENNKEDKIVEEKKTCDTRGDAGCSAEKQKKDESREEYADRRRLDATLCRIQKK